MNCTSEIIWVNFFGGFSSCVDDFVDLQPYQRSINATEEEGFISTSAGAEISFRKGTWSYFVGGLLNQELTYRSELTVAEFMGRTRSWH